MYLNIDEVEPNRNQPRQYFDEDALSELAESIREHGVIQPLLVIKKENYYEIIAGERRWRAARQAGLQEIPVIVKDYSPQEAIEVALIENIQREDLDAIEVAVSFQRLIDECSLTQEAMAERVGKKRATVTNYLRLLKLPAEIQFAIRAKKISMGHAKSLLGVENPKIQLKLANQIIEQDLSVRQVEAKVQNLNKEKKAKKEKETIELPENYFKVIETLGKYFNNNISVKRSDKGAGELTIRFSSDKEMDDFLSAIENANL
jgi:ParB family chromosome partitioning protein